MFRNCLAGAGKGKKSSWQQEEEFSFQTAVIAVEEIDDSVLELLFNNSAKSGVLRTIIRSAMHERKAPCAVNYQDFRKRARKHPCGIQP